MPMWIRAISFKSIYSLLDIEIIMCLIKGNNVLIKLRNRFSDRTSQLNNENKLRSDCIIMNTV